MAQMQTSLNPHLISSNFKQLDVKTDLYKIGTLLICTFQAFLIYSFYNFKQHIWGKKWKKCIKNTAILSQCEPVTNLILSSNFHWLLMVELLHIS